MSSPERDGNPPNDAPEFTTEELETARDEVLETIMLFREYPQPKPWRPGVKRDDPEFNLYDFLESRVWEYLTDSEKERKAGKFEGLELVELLEFFVLAITDHGTIGAFADTREKWEKRVTEWVRDFLDNNERGISLVEERAEKIREEEQE
jgi:hypothetical protein